MSLWSTSKVRTLANVTYLRHLGSEDIFFNELCVISLEKSSSGIIEAPSLGVPTINLGGRQAGRIRPPSVIDCDFDESEIRAGISKALSRDFLTSVCSKKINPF